MRFGYLLAGMLFANMLFGVLTGRGKDRNFYSKSDEPSQGVSKAHNDPILSIYQKNTGMQ